MTAILCPIRSSAVEYESATAVVTDSENWSFGRLDGVVSTIACNLTLLEIGAGQRIAFLASPSPESIALYFALFRVGAIAVPLSPRDPISEQFRVAEAVAASAIIWDGPIIETLVPIYSGDVLLRPHTVNPIEPVLSCDQPCILVRTSGSQGSPKFAMLSVGNLYYSAIGVMDRIHLEPGDRWLLSVPTYHVSGLGILFRCFVASATVVIGSASETLLESMFRLSASHLSVVPTQLIRLLNDPVLGSRTWAWRNVMMSGAELPPRLVDDAKNRHIPLITAYGLTEMSSAVTAGPPVSAMDSGTALPFRELRLGPKNEIQVRGKTLFLGYWLESQCLSLPLTMDGWFSTGDIGVVANGHWQISGRIDDMFVSGGENIHPTEIERVLNAILRPTKLMVVGVPHAEFGHRPVAIMDPPIPIDDLRRRLERHLPSFKIPDSVVPWISELDQWDKLSRKKAVRLLTGNFETQGL